MILDFRLRIENHCKIFPRNVPKSAAIPDFRGGNLGIAARVVAGTGEWPACSTIVVAVENGPPAA